MNKKIYCKLIAAVCMLCALFGNVFAADGVYEPGITGERTAAKGEYNYQEVVALSGEPILLSGTVKLTESKNKAGSKVTAEYKLENTAKSAKLDRKIVYINTDKQNESSSQVSESTAIDPKFKETVQIGSNTYTLTSYQYSRSGLTDDKAIIQYNVSSWNGRKTYARSGGGEVVVDIKADTYSYQSYWSTTETSFIDNALTYRYRSDNAPALDKEAVGTVQYSISNSKIKSMDYMLNEPTSISFKGGYILKENEENVVSYVYDVPAMTDWKDGGKRSKGRSSYKLATVPTQTRLFAPAIKDVANSYWAAADINAIAALDIIGTVESDYFRPLSYISRGEFTRAIVKAANIPDKPVKTKDLLFDDVEKNHPYFTFINTAINSGIMSGTADKKFSPDDYLTKAQAATILVRAMGLENTSAVSASKTSFADDGKIPAWSKKSINIAREMGIISGNDRNELAPDKLLTRAEVAEMLNKFINYLQYDIRKEYREKLINYGR
jgi:N-acetylmuramoyl-L-alanine amidase